MSIIRVNNLTFSYPLSFDNIFSNVSFVIDSNWKLGLVGRNGRGKTTLMKLLLGEYDYSGSIVSSVTFDYFPFKIKNKRKTTEEILIEICPFTEEWEFIKELDALSISSDVMKRSFATLSNGEQVKVLLAALFLKPNNFLLIDEPTNHLDMETRKIISSYLKKKKGFILASHDRYLLDESIDHVLSINRSNIEVQSGNYSLWFNMFEKKQKNEIEKNNQIKKEIKSMEEASRQSFSWSMVAENRKNGVRNSGSKIDKGYVSYKAARMMKRAKNIENRREKKIDEKSKLLKNLEVLEPLKITKIDYHKNNLVSYKDVSIFYNNKLICKNVSFEINRGDRVFIKGKNGSGKSSLLKLLMDDKINYTGDIKKGTCLKISYVSQDTSFLEGKIKDFVKKHKIDESVFKSNLRKLGFERVQFEKNMEDFSQGQKKKVLIAKSLCEEANLYIWDEPLNYIDIYSRKQIEDLILEYSPTMLIVEHDIVFYERVGTKIFEI